MIDKTNAAEAIEMLKIAVNYLDNSSFLCLSVSCASRSLGLRYDGVTSRFVIEDIIHLIDGFYTAAGYLANMHKIIELDVDQEELLQFRLNMAATLIARYEALLND